MYVCVCIILYSSRILEIIHCFDKKLAKSSESSVDKGKKPVDGKSVYMYVHVIQYSLIILSV